jgi:hypothetical protein
MASPERPHHVHDPMLSADVFPTDEMVTELTEALRPRVAPESTVIDLERRVRVTLEKMAPVHVTTFLPVLLERRIRQDS